MTNMDFLSVSSPSSYWQTSRAPRYSLSFALPLLLFYQVLAVLLAHGTRSVRNGADVILQSLFVAVAGSWGPLVFMVCLIGVGLWLVARDLRKSSRLRATIFCGMLAEAVMLALLDRKSTRLNSSHTVISYAVFCLKKKTITYYT